MTLPHHTDRRTVVKGAAALIGTPLLGGVAAADDTVRLEVLEQSINPESEGVIPTEVTFAALGGVPTVDIWFGHVEQFVVEREGEIFEVGLPPDADEVLANPVRTQSHPAPDTWIMDFRTEDVDFSEVSGDQVTMALGFFPGETRDGTQQDFDTDKVRLVPG